MKNIKWCKALTNINVENNTVEEHWTELKYQVQDRVKSAKINKQTTIKEQANKNKKKETPMAHVKATNL